MMGPVAEAVFVPTDIDQGIALPLRVMLWLFPLVSIGHVPAAFGSMVGIVPAGAAPLELDPLELLLDAELLELPLELELPRPPELFEPDPLLDPELPWAPELEPSLELPPLEPATPLLLL